MIVKHVFTLCLIISLFFCCRLTWSAMCRSRIKSNEKKGLVSYLFASLATYHNGFALMWSRCTFFLVSLHVFQVVAHRNFGRIFFTRELINSFEKGQNSLAFFPLWLKSKLMKENEEHSLSAVCERKQEHISFWQTFERSILCRIESQIANDLMCLNLLVVFGAEHVWNY